MHLTCYVRLHTTISMSNYQIGMSAGCRSYLTSYGAWGACIERVRKLLGTLAGPVRAACERGAAVGAHGRAQRALAQLHLGVKRFVHTDTLMLPTLGAYTSYAFVYCARRAGVGYNFVRHSLIMKNRRQLNK